MELLSVAVRVAAVLVGSYLLGCFNGAVIVSKYILRDDVRNHGSGNAGLTNFHRTFGGPLTAAVIACDVVKAMLSVWLGAWLFGAIRVSDAVMLGKYVAALFCLLGHMFPVMFQFKGGKGILSGGTIALMLDWRIALVVWGGFLILVVLTRYVSLGSCWAGASFPFATAFVLGNVWLVLIGIVCGGLILYQHRSNIKRLLNGTENKLRFRKKAG